ncbi:MULTISPECIES: hypothetical protein [Aphanizomenonaceae]|uniref:hypothetical protein n=1 Tax=Aphanizomenonaceae TaxID=1892259 RepID=UPI00136456DE|nr:MULTISPECIES: hypothetical protein [Aphanizomenonaceae]
MTFPVRDWEREFSGFASTEASATGKLKASPGRISTKPSRSHALRGNVVKRLCLYCTWR